MAQRLVLDFNNMLAPNLGGRGIHPDRLDAAAERFRAVYAQVEDERRSGRLGFFDLPYQDELVGQIRRFADGLGQSFDNVVVLGIGGSGLGTIALQQALLQPAWNELDDEAREFFPRLFVLDNIDPSTIGPFLDRIDLRRTLFNVVSKSGTTAETMAQYLVIRERLARIFPDDGYRRHLLFTTDPDAGVLRRIADEERIATLPIPPTVGGRFSILSAVGLLPAALAGIDVEALLAGARDMDRRCRTDALLVNPAGLFATLQFLAHSEAASPLHVMFAYSDRLFALADWFRQLWAESLGKRYDRQGAEVFTGPTPIKALGPTDQHSQVQLYIEGPLDKTITFLALGRFPVDLVIPDVHPDVEALAYLGGHTMGGLLQAERLATARALADEGRMNMTIELPELSAHAVGEFLMLLQIATIYAGALYGVDPLDQPGVELGKRLTYGLMGRKGFPPVPPSSADTRWISR